MSRVGVTPENGRNSSIECVGSAGATDVTGRIVTPAPLATIWRIVESELPSRI